MESRNSPKKSKHFRRLSLYLPSPPPFVTPSGYTGWKALLPCLISGASSGLNQLFTKTKRAQPNRFALSCCLHAHARSHPEGGGDGGKYGNHDVQDFAPDFFVHFILKG